MSTQPKWDNKNAQMMPIKRQGQEEENYGLLSKVPPQAVPLEEAVLGALMMDKDALYIVLDILKPESFYKSINGLVYGAILQLFEKNAPIDMLSVSERLRQNEELDAVGGPYYLVELSSRVASSANIEYHARIIAEKAMLRGLVRVSMETIKNVEEGTMDVFDVIEKVETDIFKVSEAYTGKAAERLSSIAIEHNKELEAIKERAEKEEQGIVAGVPTGFQELDKLTLGFEGGDLTIIAARPGMGKTGLVLSMMKALAEMGVATAMFSLEMKKAKLFRRILSQEIGLSTKEIRNPKKSDADWELIQAGTEKLSEYPIYIDDSADLNIFELGAKVRRLVMKHDVKLVILDYLQLMGGQNSGYKGNREQEISGISRGLKRLAQKMDIPIIALSQLSRAVETRGGAKRPQLSDLRESGSLEQDASNVWFIYRPEYYNILEDDEGNSTQGLAEIIVAKNREGATQDVPLKFIGKMAKFEDMPDPNFDFDQGSTSLPTDIFQENQTMLSAAKKRDDDEDIPF